MQFLALGQAGVLCGQLATTNQLANGIVGGTDLEELLALVLLNQVCSNAHWLLLLVCDLAAVGDVHHCWLQFAGTGVGNSLVPKNAGIMHARRKNETKYGQNMAFVGCDVSCRMCHKTGISVLTSFCMSTKKESHF